MQEGMVALGMKVASVVVVRVMEALMVAQVILGVEVEQEAKVGPSVGMDRHSEDLGSQVAKENLVPDADESGEVTLIHFLSTRHIETLFEP